jgi:L-asparaginase
MSILVITTGGTIGALPYEDPQNPPEFSRMPPEGQDLVRDALKTTFAELTTRCITLEPRDSKLIDESYRQNILTIVANTPEKAILITHGTDTILTTADFFYQQFNANRSLDGKAVILTGAMTPLSNGEQSDGHLNLSYSLERLAHCTLTLASTNVVLCDFDEGGAWKPRLYPYRPNQWEKFYDSDGRYSRIKEVSNPSTK